MRHAYNAVDFATSLALCQHLVAHTTVQSGTFEAAQEVAALDETVDIALLSELHKERRAIDPCFC